MIEWGIMSTVLILAVLLVRRCFRGKIPRGLQYGLWLIVLVRLFVPVSFIESPLSILNYLSQWKENSLAEDVGNSDGEAEYFYEPVYTNIPDVPVTEKKPGNTYSLEKSSYLANEQVEVSPAKDQAQTKKEEAGMTLLFCIWLIGAGIMAGFFGAVNLCYYKSLKKSAVLTGTYEKIKVYDTQKVASPCLFGLFKPVIWLDESKITSKQEKEYILLHEAVHYKHGDHIWAVLRAMALCLHWYNPAVWAAAYTSQKDCELACDESVIKKIGEENRIVYGETLLHMICQSRCISNMMCTATTMVGTRKSIKERIKSVAEKSKISMAAVIFLAVVMVIAAACTFTGKDSQAEDKALIKKAEEKLFENKKYTADMEQRYYVADYDRDGEKEAFLFVKTDKEETTDIFYYDNEDLNVYRTEKTVEDLEQDVYVMELPGKTFCVYHEKADEGIVSRVCGVRDGNIVNYFMDYKAAQTNGRYIMGKILSSDGNDIEVSTYNHLAGSTMYGNGQVQENFCTMTEYLFYDEKNDCISRYPVYAITKEELLSMEGGRKALDEFLQSTDTDYYTLAKCSDKLFFMVQHGDSSGDSSYKHSTYEYNEEENRVGKHIEEGEGCYYEYLDQQSVNVVNRYEQDKFNACCDFIEAYKEDITVDGMILAQNEEIGDERAMIRTYEWTEDDEILVHITEIAYEYVNGQVHLKEGKQPVTTTYNEIRSLEEYRKAYCSQTYGEEDCLTIPDLFLYNLLAEIADKNITKYMDAQTALLAYFHFSGGAVSGISYETKSGVEIGTIEYEFPDKDKVTVELYKDYRGVWSVVQNGDGFSDGYEMNLWYGGLTQEALENAVPADRNTFSYDFNEPLILVTEDKELSVSAYYPAFGESYGMLIKCGGRENLLPVYYDWQNLPELIKNDYDGDKTAELSVINCAGRGTGVYWESISVIDTANQLFDRVYHLYPENVIEIIADRLKIMYDADNRQIELQLSTPEGNSEQTLYLDDFLKEREKSGESSELGSISYGNHCYMSIEDTFINCDVHMEYVPKNYVTGYDLTEVSSGDNILGWIRVQMRYLGNGEFAFENILFSQENPWQ